MASAQIQGPLWGAHADDWAHRAEPTTAPLWRALLDALEVGKGTELLDVGCGGGGLATEAAARGARVAGLDASENLIAIAGSRVPGGRFEQGDFESLPFDAGSFDVVTACNVLQFVDDRGAALAEVRRVLKPGGRFGVGMWAEPSRCEMGVVFRTVMSVAPPPPETGKPDPPTLTEEANLVAALESGGFKVQEVGEVECVFEYENADEAWKAFRSAGMVVAVARKVGDEVLASAVKGALREKAAPDGSIRLSNWFRYVVAG